MVRRGACCQQGSREEKTHYYSYKGNVLLVGNIHQKPVNLVLTLSGQNWHEYFGEIFLMKD